jgi:hypothetical protein
VQPPLNLLVAGFFLLSVGVLALTVKENCFMSEAKKNLVREKSWS